jgi:hypothetical protein
MAGRKVRLGLSVSFTQAPADPVAGHIGRELTRRGERCPALDRRIRRPVQTHHSGFLALAPEQDTLEISLPAQNPGLPLIVTADGRG